MSSATFARGLSALPVLVVVIFVGCMDATAPQPASDAPLLARKGSGCMLESVAGGTGSFAHPFDPGNAFFDVFVGDDYVMLTGCPDDHDLFALNGQTLPFRFAARLHPVGKGKVSGNAVMMILTPGGERTFTGHVRGRVMREGGRTFFDFDEVTLHNQGGRRVGGTMGLVYGADDRLEFDTEMLRLD